MIDISIVIPTLNRPKYLKECIESCLNQDFSSLEVIVADNASETKEANIDIINSIDSPILSYHYYDKRLPMGLNWSRSLLLAKGKYIKILCDDDFLHKDYCKVGFNLLEKNKDAVLFSCERKPFKNVNEIDFFKKFLKFKYTFYNKDSISLLSYLDVVSAGTPTQTLFSRKIVEYLNPVFDAKTFFEACDAGCWINLYKKGGLVKCNDELCYERLHEGQAQRNWDYHYHKKVYLSLKNELWYNNNVSKFKSSNLVKPDKLVRTILLISQLTGRIAKQFKLSDIMLINQVINFYERVKNSSIDKNNRLLSKYSINTKLQTKEITYENC